MRSHYWCCSKFADWLRGTPKLAAGTSEEWEEWETKARGFSKFRYWLADDALSFCEKVFYYPTDKIYDLKYYINNRFVTRTHALTAHPRNIKPGQWCDVGHRFLPCLFNELQDFVEVELAWFNIAWDSEGKKKYEAPFWSTGWFRWRTWRCPQAGLDNLDWQRNLIYDTDYAGMDIPEDKKGKPTPQAVKAQEILDLYKWWTEVYPNRPDPHDASGWTAYCEAKRARRLAEGKTDNFWASFNDKTPEEREESSRALDAVQKIEAAYEKEDEEMMIRLIKVRHGLWT